jgi:hypothetical protein
MRELEMTRLTEAKRLGDRERPVPEEGIRRDELDVDEIAAQGP